MSVCVLIITHQEVGRALINAATVTFGELPLPTKSICIEKTADPAQKIQQLKTLIQQFDQGNGVLILTDIFGSTPSNIAGQLKNFPHTRMVSGINLPMLIRIMNYPDLSLEDLTQKALSGGREGVMDCNK